MIRPHRWRRLAWALAMAWAAASWVACTNAPTLPVPPPNAIAEAPDAEGFVTIRVSGAEPEALVLGLNERTGAGTIDTADGSGEATLRLRAEVGDVVQVWQRVGSQSGEVVDVIVPSPSDAGTPPDAGAPDGG